MIVAEVLENITTKNFRTIDVVGDGIYYACAKYNAKELKYELKPAPAYKQFEKAIAHMEVKRIFIGDILIALEV